VVQRETANMAIREFMQLIMVEFVPLRHRKEKRRFSKFNNNICQFKKWFIETPFWKYISIVLNTTDPLLFDSKQK
jgi:CRISPR/Cas system-associated protein endoribonuclease Cas2